MSSYGFQKLAVEYFAKAAWDQYRLPYTLVRPFNCVGIGESRALGDHEILSGNVQLAMSHVVPDLVQKVLKGQDALHVLGTGEQVRHYTYGGDLAAGVVTAMEHEDALNEDFNLSTGGNRLTMSADGEQVTAAAITDPDPETALTSGAAATTPGRRRPSPADPAVLHRVPRTGQPTRHPSDALDTAAIIHLADYQQ